MKITIELKNSVQGLVLLKELNDMIETETVTDFGKEMLINFAQAVVAATETKEHEEIDSKPTTEELLACETFEPEKIDYNGSWGRDPQ